MNHRSWRKHRMLATVALAAIAAAGCTPSLPAAQIPNCEPEPTPVGGQHVRGCLTARDQASAGAGITVDAIDITGASGWIVLHTDDHGEPGLRNGVIAVPQGRSSNITVPAATPLTTGTYWPMLHLDGGTPGAYEFPSGPDVPVLDSQGIVMKRIHVTVS